MSIEEIELMLSERRRADCISLKQNLMGSRNLQPSIIDNIEKGNNYRIVSLLKYINALNLRLFINDVHVKDVSDFGKSIKDYRQRKNYTQFDMIINCNFNPTKIVRLEKGHGTRLSLDTLLKQYPDFKLELKV